MKSKCNDGREKTLLLQFYNSNYSYNPIRNFSYSQLNLINFLLSIYLFSTVHRLIKSRQGDYSLGNWPFFIPMSYLNCNFYNNLFNFLNVYHPEL